MEMQSQSGLLGRGLNWWWAGLSAFVPTPDSQSLKGKKHIRCFVEEGTLTLSLIDKLGNSKQPLTIDLSEQQSAFEKTTRWFKSLRKYPVVLACSSAQGLTRNLQLPVTASDNLNRIIQFEIERQTPFRADQVYSGYRIQSVESPSTMALTLVVVPKKIVTSLIEQLAFLQLNLLYLQIASDSNDSHGSKVMIEIPLPSDSSDQIVDNSRLNLWLLVLVGTLILTLLYRPVMQFESATETLQQRIDIVKKRATVTNELRQRNEDTARRARFLDSKLTDHRLRLDLIEELTNLLPDSTWLSRCEIRDNRIIIRGESASASELITLLTGSDSFDDVRFSAPITRNDKSGKDRFSITADITPRSLQQDV